MKSSQLTLLILSFICSFTMIAQTNDQKELELDLQEDVSDQGTWTDAYLNMNQRRFKINQMPEVELLDIPFLNDKNAKELYTHIQNYGPIENMQELQVIEGFDLLLIRHIAPFLDLQLPFQNTVKAFRNEPIHGSICIQNTLRLERAEAYQLEDDNPNKYKGSPVKRLIRIQCKKSNTVNFGLIYKKDAGELLSNGHISGYMHFKLNRFLDQLVIGDYTCLFGQGMHIGTGLSVNKTTTVGQSIKVSKGFNPLHSGAESNYLRGLGLQFKLAGYHLYVLGSITNQDLRVSIDSNAKIQTPTGYYRNQNEIEARNKAYSIQYLTRLEKTSKQWRGGISLSSEYKHPKKDYSFLDIEEKALKVSFDYIYSGKGFTLFGESMSSNGKLGSVNGFVVNINAMADLLINYRIYQKSINLNNSTSLMETGDGEKGMFVSYNQKTSKHGSLNIYFDFYSLSNYSPQADAPNKNKEVRIEYTHEKRNGPKYSVRFSQKDKSKNESGTQILNRIDNTVRYSLRFHLEYPLGRNIRMFHRMEQSMYRSQFGTSSSGYLSYHEMKFKINDKFQFYCRYSGFETNSYDSRIYVYEHDISYTYTNKAYYGKGNAVYLLLHYQVKKNLKFKLRFAGVKQENQATIGSGLDTIDRNRIHDVRMELEFKI